MVKRLLHSVREYKKSSVLTSVFVTLEVLVDIVIPLLMAVMIDRGIEGGDRGFLLMSGIALIVCAALGLLFGVLSGVYCAEASTGFAKNLRKDMYYRIQDFSFANIDRFSVSSLVTRLTTDVTNVQLAYMMTIRIAVRAPLMLVFSIAAACIINVRLTLIFATAIPVLAVGLYFIATKAHPYFEKVFRTYDDLNNVVQENVSAIRVVKSFVRQDHEMDKFSAVSEKIYRVFSKAEGIVSYNMPLMQFAVYGCLLLISWFGAKMIVVSGGAEFTTGELSSLIAYAMTVLSCLMMLSMILVMVNMARASMERIVEVLEEKINLNDPEDPVHVVNDGSISFKNVTFGYRGKDGKQCLKGISLDIPAGATVGIVGGTGSGKSSLVQLIPRLYDVTEGSVLVGGRDVREYGLHDLRNEVAMVLQKNELFSGTIKENLRWGNAEATDEQLKHACVLAQADPFIETFPDGYDTYIEQGGTNVSGGQKQRLCIARALLKKPKILILDDSTSAVDTKTDALIRKAFREDIPDTTKLIIAQRISSVEDADMIVVMDEGTVDAVGTHGELLENNDIYREIYESQVKGDEQ